MSILEAAKYVDELLTAVVQNLRELLYIDQMRGLSLDFEPWAAQVFTADWQHLGKRARELQQTGAWKEMLRDHRPAGTKPLPGREPLGVASKLPAGG